MNHKLRIKNQEFRIKKYGSRKSRNSLFIIRDSYQKGFTLLELVIYVAIIAMVLILVSDFAWNIIYGDLKTAAYREVQQNARLAMEKITRTIQSGQNPTTVFNVINSTLYEGVFPLTTEQVAVTNLQFTPVSNTYKINLSIEYKNPGGRNEYSSSIDLETTAVPWP